MKKLLIIRFSSIGDIIQCMSVTAGLKQQQAVEIHWITRKDMAPMLSTDPNIDKIWEFDRKDGIVGLMKLARKIKPENYDYVYDAHLNTRSLVVKNILCSPIDWIFETGKCIVRKKNRLKRFMFFNLKIKNALRMPFRGMYSFQEPLIKKGLFTEPNEAGEWNFPEEIRAKVNLLIQNFEKQQKLITIVPSAAWELKRWPIEHWCKLIELLPDYHFIITAGPDDTFTSEIEQVAPRRVLNLTGKTSLLESFYLMYKSKFVISADTGFLHAADLFGKKSIAFMGPTAFGHTTGKQVKVFEIDLPCRPCTKEGNSACKLTEIKKCLVEITPKQVAEHVNKIFKV